MKTALLLALALSVVEGRPASAALTYPPKPSSGSWTSDSAGLLDDAAMAKIDELCFKLWKDERVPLYVVTINSLFVMGADEDTTIERYAYNLFNHWGIGSQKRNYGMLLLVSPGDRKARIELGGGWGISHDIQAQQIMQEQIVARFKEGDFPGGVIAGVKGMDRIARGLSLPSPYLPPWQLGLWIGGIVLCVLIGISLIKNGQTGWGWAFLAAAAAMLFFLLKAMADTKSTSSSSSGGFGGGSSGGGGATGSW